MLRFDFESYSSIWEACEKKSGVEFLINKSSTPFRNTNEPGNNWVEYPIPKLPREDYASIFAGTGEDDTGRLMRLQIVVYLDGGKMYYKNADNDVAVSVRW